MSSIGVKLPIGKIHKLQHDDHSLENKDTHDVPSSPVVGKLDKPGPGTGFPWLGQPHIGGIEDTSTHTPERTEDIGRAAVATDHQSRQDRKCTVQAWYL